MSVQEQIDKYKNVIINLVIILLALVIAAKIYGGKTAEIDSLKVKISEEEKKNLEFDKINRIEKKKVLYKKLFAKKEASLVMADINDIAKLSGVKVSSVKPSQKETAADYSKDVFEVVVSAASYDILAKFISTIESFSNVYVIDGMKISFLGNLEKKGLNVNLRISSLAAN